MSNRGGGALPACFACSGLMYVQPQATEPACDMDLAAKGAAVVATRRRHRTSPTGSRETRSRLCAAPPLPPSRARTTRSASESPLRLVPGPASYRSSAVLPCVSAPHFTAPPRGLASQLQGLACRLAVKCPSLRRGSARPPALHFRGSPSAPAPPNRLHPYQPFCTRAAPQPFGRHAARHLTLLSATHLHAHTPLALGITT